MSIQGSVNQLFTIGGSFAGMYGLLHPEISQGKQLMKDIKSRLDYVQESLSKNKTEVNEMSKEQLNEFEDAVNMTSETEEKLYSDIHKNPSLLKNKEIKKGYDEIVKSKDELDYDDVRKAIANRREVLNKPNIPKMRKIVPKVTVRHPADIAQTELQTEGIQKVEQNATYEQRRKDKGDI